MAERKDRLIRFLLPGAHARGAIIRAENIVEDATKVHGLSDTPAELFGKTLIASILLLSISKGGMRQVLQLDALPEQIQAPIKRILAEARLGTVRGYLNWGEDGLQTRGRHEHGISAWMGRPIRTSVLRDLGIGQPYLSTIEHDSDFMADHILHFLTLSAQIQSDVVMHGDLGMMIEAIPGSDQDHWFKAVEAMAKITDEQLKSDDPESILDAFAALDCKIVSEDEYAYQCSCKPETMAAALHNIPVEELHELADKNGMVTLSCQYCNSSYELDVHSIDN
ncbi:MAG: Hsp33 family molecular chaperone HslO [Mariprofundaceae bacterium]